jgi:hypothetical protein
VDAISDNAGKLSVRCASLPHDGQGDAASRSEMRRSAAKWPHVSQR